MIVIKVELWSAVTKKKTELARMTISNDGTGTDSRCNYDVATIFGRSTAQLDKFTPNRTGKVSGHRRHALHIWHLVAKALKVMEYGNQ